MKENQIETAHFRLPSVAEKRYVLLFPTALGMGEICACVLAKTHHNNASCPYLSMKSFFRFPLARWSSILTFVPKEATWFLLTNCGILLTFVIDNGCSSSQRKVHLLCISLIAYVNLLWLKLRKTEIFCIQCCSKNFRAPKTRNTKEKGKKVSSLPEFYHFTKLLWDVLEQSVSVYFHNHMKSSAFMAATKHYVIWSGVQVSGMQASRESSSLHFATTPTTAWNQRGWGQTESIPPCNSSFLF